LIFIFSIFRVLYFCFATKDGRKVKWLHFGGRLIDQQLVIGDEGYRFFGGIRNFATKSTKSGIGLEI